MEPHSYCMLDRFTPDGAGGFTKEATHTLSTTTTYGMEAGDRQNQTPKIRGSPRRVVDRRCRLTLHKSRAGARSTP